MVEVLLITFVKFNHECQQNEVNLCMEGGGGVDVGLLAAVKL